MVKTKIPVDGFAEFTAANSDNTVYTVSSNRVLTVTDIVISNQETSAITVTIWDGAGGTKKFKVEVAANSTESIRMGNGPRFSTSVVAQVDVYTNGSSIFIGGFEE
jgi:hypothetical protein